VARPTDIRLVELALRVEPVPFRAPLKFGGRVVDSGEILHVKAVVEGRDGRRASGAGSMPLGNVWGWPSAVLDPARTAEASRRVAAAVVDQARAYRGVGHPLDIMEELEHGYRGTADEVTDLMKLPEPMPMLMILVVASPLDAAVHDAFGKLHKVNVYNAYGPDFANRDLAAYLTPEFAGEYLDRYTLRQPKARMPLYHLVGALDPLTPAEVSKPIGDGLPETLGEWIVRDGLTHMKIKLNGEDIGWDVSRVAAVERVAVEAQGRLGRAAWHYSLDFNEKCKDVEYVLEFLRRLGESAPPALERVQYIEQPTARDLKSHPKNRMHAAAKIKPVVIDESLVDLETLQLAIEQGYSGVALKACKGHTQALLAGAYAQKHKLFLCVQDLTCPGASFLHSAGIAARLPTIAAIEGNGRQYCPAGNRGWAEKYPTLFHVKDGAVETGLLTGPGLGF
jgi:L-alanine-DL-glutamate epimerase-like enolase superfamily enzyme